MTLSEAVELVRANERIDRETALTLYNEADLPLLGSLAHGIRLQKNNDKKVTYAVDRNINYTNVCSSKCKFCAFYAEQDSGRDYVLTEDELKQKVEETLQLGGTHILFQGGHNKSLDLDWHLKTISFVKSLGIGVHGYSPPEITFFAKQAGLTIAEVIDKMIQAGLGSIPGGGAEILVDEIRRKVAPGKATTDEWLVVMKEAHNQGLRTTATMMFGHIESINDRISHMLRLRELQDETKGFTAFIPWPFQPDNTDLSVKKAGGAQYLRTLAISRIVLDNFDHLQASWVTQGEHIGQIALHFGADDLGTTMIEENVVAAAGVSNRLSEEKMRRLIAEAGFSPCKRDVFYNSLEE